MAEYVYGFVPFEEIPEYKMVRREEVVRCRDCKHYADHEWILITEVSDVCHFFGDGVKVEPDGFCAWGVRREDA